MEQSRLQCQQLPSYGYPMEAATSWMISSRRDNTTDGPISVKFPQHPPRTSPYQSPPSAVIPSASSSRLSSGPRSAMARRNERERKRVRLVNHGFATLRQYLPQGHNARKKLSKMETLRSAIEYIKQLQFLLDPTSSSSSPPPSRYTPDASSSDPSWSGPPSWDDTWAQQQQQPQQPPPTPSPPPHSSLSPDTDLMDFAAFS